MRDIEMVKITSLAIILGLGMALEGCQMDVSAQTPVVSSRPVIIPGSVSIGSPGPTYDFNNPINEGKHFRRNRS
jgi:hypothetical protein